MHFMMGDSQLSEPKTAQVKEAKETMNTEDNKVGHNNKAEEEKKAAKTEDETKAPPGETCHTKRLNRIYEKDGFVVNEDISNSSKVKDKYHKFALTSTQNFDHENKPTKKTLRINSPYILKALGEVVKYYPSQGGGFDQPLDIESPFEILYHHKQELIERKESVDSEVSKEHLNLLLDYLDNEPGAEAEALIKSGKITFDLLWAIFKPGDLIYTIENEHERLYWLQSSSRGNSPWKGEYLRLKCSYHAWDGTLSGRALTDLRVYQNQECPGKTAVAITSLSISSLKYYSDRARIEKKLAARGKIYKNLTERCVRRYDGLCMRLKLPPGSRYYGEEDSFTGVWLPQMVRTELFYPVPFPS